MAASSGTSNSPRLGTPIHLPDSDYQSGDPGSRQRPRPARDLTITLDRQRLNAEELDLDHDADVEEARKAWREGDFSEVKQALWNMLNRVDELSSHIRNLMAQQAEMQTSLTVAQSNLTLALSNTEMLEEALSRTPASAQSIGWRRWSAKEGLQRSAAQSADIHSRSSIETSSSFSNDESRDPTSAQPLSSDQIADSDRNGFFHFRKGTKNATPTTASSIRPPFSGTSAASERYHLTSASVPSLSEHSELDELKDKLRKERAANAALKKEKADVENELENLSQALFEEANRMVAEERKRRASAEDDLKDCLDERDAVRSALKLVEEENRRLRENDQMESLPPKPRPLRSLDPSHDDGREPKSFLEERDVTPTQAETQISDLSFGVDGMRADQLWRDAMSSPKSAQFRRSQ